MKLIFVNNVPGVLLMSLVLLASAQRNSNNNFKDVDLHELARQNKITKQILEAFIQKKLGLSRGYVKPPSIQEILPIKKPEERNVRHSNQSNLPDSQLQETQEYAEDDSLQSVESEQIDSIYDEGRSKKYPGYDNEVDANIDQNSDKEFLITEVTSGDPTDNTAESPPTEEPPDAGLSVQETTNAEEVAEIDSDFLMALGDPADERPTYGEKIHQNLADRWLPILRRGLSKENKDSLLKELTIPENCKLLRAPKLNPEISAAISESTRTRDKKFEAAQQQLGLGISAINRALTVLVTSGEDKENKVKVIKMLSDSCRILSDLHFVETQARIKAITPALDKAFLHVVEDVERDESLFGSKLTEKIKASKTIEKQGLQIKKPALQQKKSSSTPLLSKNRYQGNWTAPFRQQSSNRGGRGGVTRTTSATQRTAPAAAAPSKSSSQSKRGARRN